MIEPVLPLRPRDLTGEMTQCTRKFPRKLKFVPGDRILTS
jgi:hypothetical protein